MVVAMTRFRSAAVAAAGSALVFLLGAGSASAATTVGQLFAPIDGCMSSSLYVQTGVPSGNGYTIPSDGVITSWSYQVGNAAIIGLKLEVASPESAGSRTTVGQADAGTQTPGIATSYPTRLLVSAGDVIGIFSGGGGNCILGSGMGEAIAFHAGDVLPGASGIFTPLQGNKVPVTATVEPDADHDGFGDETQDQCPTNAATQGTCPPPPAPKDITPASLSSSNKSAKLSRTGVISFSITADENSTGTAAGTISLPRTAKLVRFHPAKVTLTAGKPATLTLRLSKRDARLVRNLLNHHKLKAKVAVTVNDAAGNRSVKKLTLRLKR
jgi:hypothetical protein